MILRLFILLLWLFGPEPRKPSPKSSQVAYWFEKPLAKLICQPTVLLIDFIETSSKVLFTKCFCILGSQGRKRLSVLNCGC